MGNFDWLFVVFLVLVSTERLWETRASRRAERGQKQEAWSLPLFYVLHIAVLASVPVEYFLVERRLQAWVTIIGLVMVVGGLALRLAAIRTLGRYWSLHVEIRVQHQLIMEGPYRYVRHPAYAAVILEFIGIPLVGNCYYSLLLVFLLYFPVLAARIFCEERALTAKFGDAYAQYRKQTGALVPRGGRRTAG
jgi:protein-S-isoprenylcysteine O-methyltransferase Ste14